ncbi:MAG: YqiA/YcfP family alpha/beta fold hydrolase [Bryobacterales bacterium]|nr:YqiA/YcfP family alpha/beta fold hydrolase [Bryobacterales bacterium]
MNYVYLHGFASSPASSKATYFRHRFADRGLELAIPALDGGDFERLTISGQLKMIAETAGPGDVTLIGSSLGGYVAALYAARHPEVKAVVLMAPAFCFPRRWEAELGAEDFAAWRRTGKRTIFHYGDGREREIGFGLIEDGLHYEDYPVPQCAALVLHGVNDTVVPVEYSREFACRQGEGARLVEYPSDHTLGDVTPAIWAETERFLFQK